MIGFVVNPVSGNGKGEQTWRIVERLLQSRQVAYSVAFTQAAYEASALAAKFVSDPAVTTIVAVGGDGTMHETVSGLFDTNHDKSFGYIPAGSGNDFARGYGIPTEPEQALDVILAKRATLRIDILRHGNGFAINSAGIGMDGQVARVTNTAIYKQWLNRLRLGKLSYVLTLIRVLISYKPCSISLTIDGSEHRFNNVWLVAVANIPYYGGGMMICPQANPTNGTVELCVVSGIGRFELLKVFPRVYKGTHISHRAVQMLQGGRVHIHADRPLDIHTDGEMAGTTPIKLEVLPAAMTIIVP